MKVRIINYLKKHPKQRRCVRFLLLQYRKCRYLIEGIGISVDPYCVVFECYMGRKYTCNPKALYCRMMTDPKYQQYHFIWAFKEPKKFMSLQNERTTVIRYGSKQYKKAYHRAKYFITNSRLPEWIIKKKNQVYIQTWHGTPLKKLGFDIDVAGNNAMNSKKELQDKYFNDAKRYDYMLSPSSFCTEKFSSAFRLSSNVKIIEQGYPRNDQLFQYTKKEVQLIKKGLHIPLNKKVILYAPTWRDDEHVSGVGYTQSLGVNFDILQRQLKKDYVILFRSHYFIANHFDFAKYKGFVYDVSNYDEINDLYIISDLLITDYSSVFFDYANLKRPILFYMYDYHKYKNQLRDFYIDLKELPGPIIKESDEYKLCQEVLNLEQNFSKFKNKYSRFHNKFNSLDDRNSSERVLEECVLCAENKTNYK